MGKKQNLLQINNRNRFRKKLKLRRILKSHKNKLNNLKDKLKKNLIPKIQMKMLT